MAKLSKTEKAICKAMMELLNDIPFERITISEIVKKADVSRSSFYNHFNQKTDINNCIIDNICDEMSKEQMLFDREVITTDSLSGMRLERLNSFHRHKGDLVLLYKAGFGSKFTLTFRQRLYEVRTMFDYEFIDENGKHIVLSDGPIYDLRVWKNVNETIANLELYYRCFSTLSASEFNDLIERAYRLTVIGGSRKKG